MYFLQQIANYFTKKHASELGQYTFVFPNRRSAMFMRKYLKENCSSISFMPRLITMNAFLQSWTDKSLAQTLELVIVLYKSYLKVLTNKGAESNARSFDSFLHWGEMAIQDFNDIDAYMADASQLFKNHRELKKINANYLTPEQLEVARILGDTRPHLSNIESFWEHVPNGAGKDNAQKFLNLWEILEDLYREYKLTLHENGLTYKGAMAKDAYAKVKELNTDDFHGRLYAFIGFSMLSTSELLIIKHMQRERVADCFWDTASPFLKIKGLKAAEQIKALAREFRMPEDFQLQQILELPKINACPIPSLMGQAKLAVRILEDWQDEMPNGQVLDTTDTAVILPKKNMLVPFLYSLPEKFSHINVAMQVPFADTPFATLLQDIITLQLHARIIRGEQSFFYKDVLAILSYPYMSLLSEDETSKLRKKIVDERLFNIPVSKFQEFPSLKQIFKPIVTDKYDGAIDYLDGLLTDLQNAISLKKEQKGHTADMTYEELILLGYHKAIDNICLYCQKYRVGMDKATLFEILRSLLRIQVVKLTGDPVEGMQVLDMNDAQSLDFTNLLITSVNEKSIPKSSHFSSVIPPALRYGFGMPTTEDLETDEAYQFYRLLGRAKRISLIYDSRTPDQWNDEVSRFITQLRLLLPEHFTEKKDLIKMGLSLSGQRKISIKKTEDVLNELAEYTKEGGKFNLSASALKNYIKCPLKFYLENVKKLSVEDFDPEYIDSASYGTFLHEMAQQFYEEEQKKCKDTFLNDHLSKLLIDKKALEERFRKMALKVMNDDYFHKAYNPDQQDSFPGEARVLSKVMARYLLRLVEWDASHDPFAFIAAECDLGQHTHRWRLTDDLAVNFTMMIDRIDRMDADGKFLRFIDYKSGSDDTSFSCIDDLFTDTNKGAIFQLMLYCVAYSDLTGYTHPILPAIYKFIEFGNKSLSAIKCNKKDVPHHLFTITMDVGKNEDGTPITETLPFGEGMRLRIVKLIKEIFDPNVDFDQTEKSDNCSKCNFKNICGRLEPKQR